MNMDLFCVGLATILVCVGAVSALCSFRAMLRREKKATEADWSGNNGYFLGLCILFPMMTPSKNVTYTYRKPGFAFMLGIFTLVSIAEAVGGGIWLSRLPVESTLLSFSTSSFGPTLVSLVLLLVCGIAGMSGQSYIVETLDHWEKPVPA